MSAPSGEKPHIRSAATQQASSHPPTRRRFEKIRPNPSAPKAMMRFDGTEKRREFLTEQKTWPASVAGMRIGR